MTKSFKLPLTLMLALMLVGLALAALAGWSTINRAQAVTNTIWADPAIIDTPPGTSVNVAIKTDPPAAGLGSWDLTVTYDDTVLTATSCTPHSAGMCNVDISGEVRILGFVGLPLTGEQTLATIAFDAIGVDGEGSPVAIAVNAYYDGLGAPTAPPATDGVVNLGEADITVVKDFSDDNPVGVTVSIVCTDGTVTVVDPIASEADAAYFTIDSFDPGATCTVTEDIGPPSGLPAGYTADESACADIPISAGTSVVCVITNSTSATFQVSKDFSDDNPADVTMSLTCTSGTVSVDDATADEGTPDTADFTITGFAIGATCTATETVPAGYTADESACDTVAITAGADSSCTITNTSTVTFQVTKDFSDDNPAEVTISLTCTTGTVTVDDATATDVPADTADFTVDGFAIGATCTATETAGLPAGYTKDESACATVAIVADGALVSCTITNTLNTATFQVSKDFTNDSTAGVTISLTCTSGTVTEDDNTASEADAADFTVNGFTLGATCTATETVPAGYTGNEILCAAVAISPAGNSVCTIVNIPLALLAWNDNDCDGTVGVRDGQWLMSAMMGAPISQSEPCPDLGGFMLPTPFLAQASWADTDCDGVVGVRDGQYLMSVMMLSPITQTESCPDAGDIDTVIPLP